MNQSLFFERGETETSRTGIWQYCTFRIKEKKTQFLVDRKSGALQELIRFHPRADQFSASACACEFAKWFRLPGTKFAYSLGRRKKIVFVSLGKYLLTRRNWVRRALAFQMIDLRQSGTTKESEKKRKWPNNKIHQNHPRVEISILIDMSRRKPFCIPKLLFDRKLSGQSRCSIVVHMQFCIITMYTFFWLSNRHSNELLVHHLTRV